eukprot:3302259-Prymnesium_polylepis.1
MADNPYTEAFLDSRFEGAPSVPSLQSLVDTFMAQPSSLYLVALSRGGRIVTVAGAESLNRTHGRAAWRRFQRA